MVVVKRLADRFTSTERYTNQFDLCEAMEKSKGIVVERDECGAFAVMVAFFASLVRNRTLSFPAHLELKDHRVALKRITERGMLTFERHSRSSAWAR